MAEIIPPEILEPKEIKSANPVFIIRPTNSSLKAYYRIQVFSDKDMTNMISEISTKDNIDAFECSKDGGITWSPLGEDEAVDYNMLLRVKVFVGSKTKVWVRTGIGYTL